MTQITLTIKPKFSGRTVDFADEVSVMAVHGGPSRLRRDSEGSPNSGKFVWTVNSSGFAYLCAIYRMFSQTLEPVRVLGITLDGAEGDYDFIFKSAPAVQNFTKGSYDVSASVELIPVSPPATEDIIQTIATMSVPFGGIFVLSDDDYYVGICIESSAVML